MNWLSVYILLLPWLSAPWPMGLDRDRKRDRKLVHATRLIAVKCAQKSKIYWAQRRREKKDVSTTRQEKEEVDHRKGGG